MLSRPYTSISALVPLFAATLTFVTQARAVPISAQTLDTTILRTAETLVPKPSLPFTGTNDRALTSRQESSSPFEAIVYYGQVISTPGADLEDICSETGIDTIALAFLTSFSGSTQYPVLSIGKYCPSSSAAQTSAGANGLRDCVASGLAKKVSACQKAGKRMLLSLGGGAAQSMIIPSQTAAQQYALMIWELFLGGGPNNPVRPFGSIVLDGIDIDIEHGSGDYLVDFLIALRKLTDTSTKQYYITAAPQCSDLVTTTSTVTATTIPWMKLAPYLDAVLVQYYNNPTCDFNSLAAFATSLSAWSQAMASLTPIRSAPTPYRNGTGAGARPNYKVVTVDGLQRRTVSPRSIIRDHHLTQRSVSAAQIKMFIGISATSEVGSGYLSSPNLAEALRQIRQKNLVNLGGLMFWDGVWAMQKASGKSYYSAAMDALMT